MSLHLSNATLLEITCHGSVDQFNWYCHALAHFCLSLAGRPFIVELTNPHRVSFTQEEITQIQTLANSATKDIFIRDLQIVSR